MVIDINEITQRYTPRDPSPEGLLKLSRLREAAIGFTTTIHDLCPPGDCRRRAEELLEQAVMLAAKSITHNP